MSKRRKRWFTALTLLGLLIFAAFLWVRPLLNIGAGYAAKHACSCFYLQGRGLEEIRENDLNFSVLGQASLTLGKSSVRASFYGLVGREAFFFPEVGCTLENDHLLPYKQKEGAAAGGKSGGESQDSVAYLKALDQALDFGMQPVPGGGARGIVILKNGTIVGERYAAGYDQNTKLLGWSMTKSLTALAWGAYYQQFGQAKYPDLKSFVNQDGLYHHWGEDARSNIGLDDLMNMNSGLGWNEAYGSLSDATIMLHEQADMAAYAYGMPTLAPPAEVWTYSSGTTNILVDLLDEKLRAAGHAGAYHFLHEVLRPIAPSLLIEPDQAGKPVGSSYGWATARDWARLGQFMLNDGTWQGDTILAPGWVDYMRQEAEGSDGAYGAQLWLPDSTVPSLPADAYMMRGFQDQRVFILPTEQLVIVRLGHNDDKVADFEGLLARVLEAL